MKRDHVENSVLPIDWTEVVGKVHEVLTQTESSAAEREKRLVKLTPPAVPTKERTKVWKHTLESFEERLQCFHAAVQKAEDNAVEADLALADAEKALEQWLVRSEKRTSVKNQPAAADRLRS